MQHIFNGECRRSQAYQSKRAKFYWLQGIGASTKLLKLLQFLQEDDNSQIISFETFMRKYCDYKRLTEISTDILGVPLPAPRRNRITFRFQNDNQMTEIPKNERIIYESDDFFVTTDESEGV